VQAVILNVHDISERKQSEQESRRFQAIIESSIDGILSVDLEGKITSWNPAAVRIFGYSEAEMLGSDFDALTPEDRLKESADFAHSAFHGKAIKDVETVRVGRDGLRIEVSLTLSPIYDRDHRISGIAVIVRDITERRRLEREVLEIADLEKHRIGQDLHDDLCQHLVGISMLGNLLYSELAHYGLKQAEDARQITQMVRDAVDHARILARGLFPLNFAQGGLMAGLETLVSNTEQLFRMPCFFECSEAVHIESSDAATHLYRIVQEALHNAVKHSQGTKVVVRMQCHEGILELSVRDDGIGPPDPAQLAEGGGLGMHTMYYRARIIGAVLSLSRNEEGGATVTCRFPLPASR
jgi:two-component system CheB/CheR fusion protein